MPDEFLNRLEKVRAFVVAMLNDDSDEASTMTLAEVHTAEEAQEWLLILCGVVQGMAFHVTKTNEDGIEFVNHVFDDARGIELAERAQTN